MEHETWFYILFTVSLIFLVSKLFSLKTIKYRNLPPSPTSLPIVGHLHLIKEPVQRTLQNLSNTYGPVLLLSFGWRKVLIVSSTASVEECFNKNDLIFANRPRSLAGKHLNYDHTTIGASSYGHHWRNLRRIAALEIFSTNRLNMYLSIRQKEVRMLLRDLFENSRTSFAKVEMKSRLSELSFNIIMRIISGKRYFGSGVENLEEAKRFREIIRENLEISGASNLGVFLPFLQWIDYQGVEKKMLRLKKKNDDFCQSLIDEHRNNNKFSSHGEGGGKSIKTIIDNMLSLQESEPDSYSDEIIKGIILVLLAAGTDTSAVTLEWALSLLANHPKVLKKARAELDKAVGNDRLVDESDYSKLLYLQSIISETFRLYPAAPLLIPHESSEDCVIGGYNVPRGTMLLVNAWAIHRDPLEWEDPTSFRPERFEGSVTEAYKLIPFGVGRRACPGAGLAIKVVSLALAALIQCFKWQRPSDGPLDMCEGTGLTMPKAQPLEVMCRARKSMISVLEKLEI